MGALACAILILMQISCVAQALLPVHVDSCGPQAPSPMSLDFCGPQAPSPAHDPYVDFLCGTGTLACVCKISWNRRRPLRSYVDFFCSFWIPPTTTCYPEPRSRGLPRLG